jgi:hypothetical protein
VPCFAGDYVGDVDLPALEDKPALSREDFIADAELPAVIGLVEVASRHEAEKAADCKGSSRTRASLAMMSEGRATASATSPPRH